MNLRATYLIPCLLWACGQHTDTTLSDSATAGSSGGVTVSSSGDHATDGLTGEFTGGLASTGSASDGVSTGSMPGTSTDETAGTTAATTFTTGEPTTATTGGNPDTEGQTGGETDESGAVIDDCMDLKAAYANESLEIRACESADQCGQQLKGTSCGCTRDWVARLDADTTHFFELLTLAGDLRCELVLAGTCDCPEADGSACTDGICTWNYL